jgi:RNA polymerase sigma-70 factor (ECF subfamily)
VIYRRCLRLLRDREQARDATQEVFLKLAREMNDLGGRHAADLVPWLWRVATFHCLDLLKVTQRQRRREADIALWDVAPFVREVDYADRSLAYHVLAAFDTQTQAVAVGVLVDGMKIDEVATVLSLSRRTVERRLAQFLSGSRDMLTGELA